MNFVAHGAMHMDRKLDLVVDGYNSNKKLINDLLQEKKD